MATRETLSRSDEPVLSHGVTAIDKGNGSIRATIPARVCEKFGIEPGDDLVIDEHDDFAVIRPVGDDGSRE